jgi:co-chaperonin GroES (HSP10)
MDVGYYCYICYHNLNNKNKMKAIGLNIVIEKINETRKVAGGMDITSADESDIRYKKGRVVTSGELASTVSDGDLIMYDGAAGHSMMIGSEQFTVIQYRDVALIL